MMCIACAVMLGAVSCGAVIIGTVIFGAVMVSAVIVVSRFIGGGGQSRLKQRRQATLHERNEKIISSNQSATHSP